MKIPVFDPTAVFGLLVVSLVFISPSMASERLALVIGNSHYQHVTALENPANDSADMAVTLEDLNFDVILLQDASKLDMQQAVTDFTALLGEGDTGLFYYAGHGVHIEGDNFLVPVDTRQGDDAMIKDQSFNVSQLLAKMGRSDDQINIIILDACRDNPFSGDSSATAVDAGSRALRKKNLPQIKPGLSKLDAPSNTLIAFATAPGRVARDGDGRNSPYSRELIRFMKRSGLPIEQMVRQVRAEVVDQTDGQQIPWESSSLIDSFYFKPRTSLPMGF